MAVLLGQHRGQPRGPLGPPRLPHSEHWLLVLSQTAPPNPAPPSPTQAVPDLLGLLDPWRSVEPEYQRAVAEGPLVSRPPLQSYRPYQRLWPDGKQIPPASPPSVHRRLPCPWRQWQHSATVPDWDRGVRPLQVTPTTSCLLPMGLPHIPRRLCVFLSGSKGRHHLLAEATT